MGTAFKRSWTMLALVMGSVGSSVPIQGKPPFEILSVPAPKYGTCLPSRAPDPRQRLSNLTITSIPPGSSREISVVTDKSGTAVVFSDRTTVSKGLTGGVSRMVFAMSDNSGSVMGHLQEMETTYEQPLPRDLDSLRRLLDSAKTNVSRRELTVAEQRKAAQVIAFLRKRCPG